MFAILQKQSRYKKYENVALIKNTEEKAFIVALHYIESKNSQCYAMTPSENIFKYNNEESEVIALKQSIEKFESIRI
ncbi:MAG: hypothetical protein PHT02_01225 [Tissierellia bacterium]|nr:hypothetical protein [Tissierellia bacterium]